MNKIENINTVVIHAGIMHSDDVFTVAYINMVRKWFNLKPAEVIRTFNIKQEYTMDNGYLVADIGGGQYDHHFSDEKKQKRAEDNVAYAAFGLVVRDFHDGFLNDYEYELFDKKFVKPLDYHDNNGSGNQLAFVIGSFNKNWDDENVNTDVRFQAAVNFATIALEQYIGSIRSLAKAKEIAVKCKPDGETIYLDKFAPISEFFSADENVKFIGAPSLRNGYQIVAIKNKEGKNKKLFPEYLRGWNPGEGMYNEAGINFCHSSGFICVFRDKQCAKEFMDLFAMMDNKE